MFTTDIYKFVEKIKRRYQTNDPYEIAEICGIEVVSRKFETMKGMYSVTEHNPYILLNDKLDEYMERVVMFHELGHHFMHRYNAVSTFKEHTLYDMSSKMEIEANTFAANFMISDEDVEQNSCYQYTSEQLARELCVPHEILLIKLGDMNSRGYDFNLCFTPRSDFLRKIKQKGGVKMSRTYIAIDLKSFYASVECRERGLDPLTTNFVVADESRTEKTICPAVSPSLKSFGIPGRPRLFEVVQKVKEANSKRLHQYRKSIRNYKAEFSGSSHFEADLKSNLSLSIDYIVAPPRMAHYMEYSTRIYDVYLKYIAPEDIHVYSIDEVFMDVTNYLSTYKMTAHDLAMTIIRDVLNTTGITATAGIGTNLYLCKIAMDIVAKKMPPDKDGVRIAELDEMSYRQQLWSHTSLTSFWRVGKGYATKLEAHNMFTMGDVAEMSLTQWGEDLLYKLFGVNAELLIDHAWGWEPCTMQDIKSYRPETNSLSSGQVLQEPYPYEKAKLVTMEMADLLALDLVEKKLVTDQIVLTIMYDIENLKNPEISRKYHGEISTDSYGRKVPKNAHGTINLERQTSSTKLILEALSTLYERIVNPDLLVRKINVVVNHLVDENSVSIKEEFAQLDFFIDYAAVQEQNERKEKELEKEKHIQHAMLDIKKKFGKNAILKGMNLSEGATSKDRNAQIGGHKA